MEYIMLQFEGYINDHQIQGFIIEKDTSMSEWKNRIRYRLELEEKEYLNQGMFFAGGTGTHDVYSSELPENFETVEEKMKMFQFKTLTKDEFDSFLKIFAPQYTNAESFSYGSLSPIAYYDPENFYGFDIDAEDKENDFIKNLADQSSPKKTKKSKAKIK